MIWKSYSKLQGTHALCAPSKSSWMNYDDEQALKRKIVSYAAPIGTGVHEYAAKSIKHKFKVNKADKHSLLRYLVVEKEIPQIAIDIDRIFPNLMTYINDSIGFEMTPEVLLYFSDDFYGTADAINYNEKSKLLRIFDLKTGVGKVNTQQLEAYAALFCTDYKLKPENIGVECRIYQNNEITVWEPTSDSINTIIHKMRHLNELFTSQI